MISSVELKIPPPVVALIIAILMWQVSFESSLPHMSGSLRTAVALIFAVTGMGLLLAGAIAFRHARTTVNPFKPQDASSLVTSGIYGITRNPMYTGLALMLLAWAVFLSGIWPFLGLPVFILYVTHFQIQPEERILSAMFGEAYREYTGRVRRWL